MAAQEAGRGFIGIELEKTYCEIAARRMGVRLARSTYDLEIEALLGGFDGDPEIDAMLA